MPQGIDLDDLDGGMSAGGDKMNRAERRAQARGAKDRKPRKIRKEAAVGEKAAEEGVATWKYIAFLVLMVGGGFQMIGPLLNNLNGLMDGVSHSYIDPTDAEQLADVFRSGDPWIVLCRSPRDKSATPAFFNAMYHVDEENMNIQFGILDCEKPLPSGKTTFERFNLTEPHKMNPQTVFYVANGAPPKQLPMAYYPNKERGESLLNFVLGKTKNSFKTVKNTMQLQKCYTKKNCALLLHPGNPKKSPELRAKLQRIVDKTRLVNWVVADSNTIKLNLEKVFPDVDAGVPEWPRLIYFKRVTDKSVRALDSVLKAKVLRAELTAQSAADFIKGQMADDSGMAEIKGKRLPQLGRRPTVAGLEAKARQKAKRRERARRKFEEAREKRRAAKAERAEEEDDETEEEAQESDNWMDEHVDEEDEVGLDDDEDEEGDDEINL